MNFTFRIKNRGLFIDIKRFPLFMSLPYIFQKFGVDLVIDVGAHKGKFIDEIQKGGYKDRVIAFEPLESNFNGLKKKFGAKKMVDIYQFALGNFSGPSRIYFDPEQTDLASLHQTNETFHGVWGDINKAFSSVNVLRLDDAWGDMCGSSKRVFMKIDTQASDHAVMEGVESNMDKIFGIQTELSIQPIYKGQKGIMDTINYLKSKGFYLHRLQPICVSGELLEADGIFFKSEFFPGGIKPPKN